MNDHIDEESNFFDGDSDSESDIATILHYLFPSGEVRIFPPVFTGVGVSNLFHDLESDWFGNRAPNKGIYVENNPDTSQLEGSDISYNIKMNSGTFNDSAPKAIKSPAKPLPILLSMREEGMNGKCQFSQGDKCQIYQRFLPNKMRPIGEHNCKVFCGSYAKDGDVFMTASQDYCVRIFNSKSGNFILKKVVTARDVGWSILDVAVSPDGSHFVYCSWSECIHICNILGDHETHEALPLYPNERRFCIFSLRFSQDGREIIGGANDECIYIFNREENKRTLKLHSHDDDVNTVAFADNTSQILFSAGDDGICKVWDRRSLFETSPKPVGILVGHEEGITYVDAKGDGRHLITNSKDQTIKLWDMRMFSPSSSQSSTRKLLSSQIWDYRWQRVPSNLYKPRKKLSGDTSLMTYRGHSVLQTLIRCHFSPQATTGQQFIYTGCAGGQVVIYDVLTGKIHTSLSGHSSCVRDVAWHPYRNEIVSSSWDGVVGKWTYSGKLALDSDSSSDDDDDDETEDSDDEFGKADQHGVIKVRRSQRLATLQKKKS